ncbi:MAG: glycosyltransferase family 4 protein [Byssovorax sp.]
MSSLRVAHVLRKYDPAEWGGTETHVVAVTRGLVARGVGAEVHAPRGPTAPDRALAPGVELRRYRAFLPFVGDAAQRRGLIANAGNIASIDEPLRLFRDRRISLAHTHTLGRIGGAVRTAMRLSGRPYVVSIHGLLLAEQKLVADATEKRHRGLVDLGSPLGALLGARRVIDDAARVITFNEDERRALAARVGDRAVRMDHGVDVARLAQGDAARARQRFPMLGDAPAVTLVGRICHQKNQVLAVRAFARGAPPDHHLCLAGAETDTGYRAEVEEEARALGVERRVHLLGNLDPNREIPDLFARSTLVIVPSTHESFGLAVLEGWAADKAVLFPRHTGLADIAAALDDDAAVLPSLDEAAWIEAIRHFLTDAGARRAAADAGQALIRRRFGWDVVVDKLIALYEDVLAEPRRR